MKMRLLALVLLVGCQPEVRGTQPTPALTTERVAAIRREVTATGDRSVQALLAGDARVVTEVFAKDFRSTGGDFQFESRDQIANGLTSGQLRYRTINNSVTDVRVPTANTAIVTGQRTVHGIRNGQEFNYTFPYTAVHVLDEGVWKVALWAVNPC